MIGIVIDIFTDSYKAGHKYFDKQDWRNAIYYLNRVKSSDENFDQAQQMIDIAEQKLEEQRIQKAAVEGKMEIADTVQFSGERAERSKDMKGKTGAFIEGFKKGFREPFEKIGLIKKQESQERKEEKTETYGIGKRIPVFYGFVTVNNFEYRGSGALSESRKEYMIVDVTVENTTSEEIKMNPLLAGLEVVDGDGYIYKEAVIEAAFDDIDKKESIEEIPPGEKRRGQFVFKKPGNTNNMILKFRVMEGLLSEDKGVLIRLK